MSNKTVLFVTVFLQWDANCSTRQPTLVIITSVEICLNFSVLSTQTYVYNVHKYNISICTGIFPADVTVNLEAWLLICFQNL